MSFNLRQIFILISLIFSNSIQAQTVLYSSGFGSIVNQLPAQWIFKGDNLNINNVGPSNGYFGYTGGAYWAEGNHKGYINTNGVLMNCSQPGNSSSTLVFSSLGHSDLVLNFGMCKSAVTYNSIVGYSLSWSVDGINFSPLPFTEPLAGRWGLVNVVLPDSVSDQDSVYLRWSFSRIGFTGFFKVDDVKIIANDFCVTPAITSQPSSGSSQCIGSSSITFSVSVTGSGPFQYQWQEDSMNITDGVWYSGTNTSSMSVLYPHYGFNGRHYRCLITNCSGDTVVSDNMATLSLYTILGDLNYDGSINNSDFVDLLAHWGMICGCNSDLNVDSKVDLLDYLIFVGQFNKSCQ